MTKNQKDFLLEYFFKNENQDGWKSIATNLIQNGKAIVAGECCIWKGGIGNFIRVEPLENSYKCSLYTFDLESFKSSEYFKGIHKQHIEVLAQKKRNAEEQYNDIINL
jgi:hypothetical protein